jgi:hypothetical protein
VNGVLFNKSVTAVIQYPDGLGASSYTIPSSVTSIGESAFAYAGLTSVTIPNSVTSIGEGAFLVCRLTSVTIPNSVSSIGQMAFYNCPLSGVTIGNSVTNIGSEAFAYCYSLASVYFQGNSPTPTNDLSVFSDDNNGTVYYLPGTTGWGTTFDGLPAVMLNPQNEFSYTTNADGITLTITGYTGPGGVVTIPININGLVVSSIGDLAFANDTSLTGVTIPNSVNSIGGAAFYGCTNLTAITVDAGNPAYSSVSGVLFNRNQTKLIQYPAGNLGTSYTIPNSVNSIGEFTFWGCTSLSSVTIGNSVTSIGYETFYDCTSLTNVTIPNSVTSIGTAAFGDCTSLTNVTIPNSVISIADYAFQYCTSLIGAYFQGNAPNADSTVFNNDNNATVYYLPGTSGWGSTFGGVPAVMLNAPNPAGSLQVTITPAITVEAGNPAYSSVNGVLFNMSQTELVEYPGGLAGSYTIPESVTSIGDYAFEGCTSLTSVTIPSSVTNIGEGAFVFCTSLTSVTIPGNVTSIGDYAFSDCIGLTSVYFTGNAPTADSTVFYDDNNATVYYLPGTTGWGTTFGGLPTALWLLPNPLILNNGPGFGVKTNSFGFIISWATNISVVVEACTNLANPVWQPVATNTLTGGTSYFSDPQWTNYPGRFYRLRSQ